SGADEANASCLRGSREITRRGRAPRGKSVDPRRRSGVRAPAGLRGQLQGPGRSLASTIGALAGSRRAGTDHRANPGEVRRAYPEQGIVEPHCGVTSKAFDLVMSFPANRRIVGSWFPSWQEAKWQDSRYWTPPRRASTHKIWRASFAG